MDLFELELYAIIISIIGYIAIVPDFCSLLYISLSNRAYEYSKGGHL